MRRKTFDVFEEDELDPDAVLRDGQGVRVPMNMLDAGQYDAQSVVDAALARHNACAGHRPGPVLDTLIFGKTTVDRQVVSDALKASTGVSLDGAAFLRAKAFADLERRSRHAWKDGRPAVLADPTNGDDEDDDEDRSDSDNQDAAIARRAEAYGATVARQDWKLKPARADAIQRQAAAWRGGR